MMKKGKIAINSLQYGDVCKRSKSNSFFDTEYLEFEKELLEAIDDAVNEAIDE